MPLEWWEHAQLDILASAGFAEEAARFRENPAAWRTFREELRKRKELTIVIRSKVSGA